MANYIPKLVATATFRSTSGLPSNTWFLGPIQAHNPNGILIGSAVFCTAHRRVSLYFTMGHSSPSKLPLCMGGSGPLSNTWFPGPTRFHNPNGISIGSAVLQGSLVWQTDRQTDHATRSVTIGRIYVRSTAMRLNDAADQWSLLPIRVNFVFVVISQLPYILLLLFMNFLDGILLSSIVWHCRRRSKDG